MDKVRGITTTTLEPSVTALRVVTAHPMLVCIDDMPVRALGAGSHKYVFRVDEGADLSLHPVDLKSEYGYSLKIKPTQRGELVDDLPPPEPPAPDSYLARIRAAVRANFGVNRESFEAIAGQPYERDDDLFEEEEIALAKEEAKAKAKAKRTAEKAAEAATKPEGTPSIPEGGGAAPEASDGSQSQNQ